MLNGFFTAASGMFMQQRTLNVLSNNIANAKTPGFRSKRVVSTTFEQALLMRQEGNNSVQIGAGAPIRIVDSVPTQFDPSFLQETGRPFDMAIEGDGFFTIQGGEQQYLTRNGNFDIDEEGYLVLRGQGRVLGEDGAIQLNTSSFSVDEDGTVYDADGRRIDRLLVVQPEDYNALQSYENGMYGLDGAQMENMQASNVRVAQGVLEQSNIDMNREMSMAMEVQRTFQSCSKALTTIDQLNQKTVNELGRL